MTAKAERKISALIHATSHEARTLNRTLETLHCCDEVLVIGHCSHQEEEQNEKNEINEIKKIAHQHGAIFKENIPGVDAGAYAMDCRHDWIFCLLPNETISEALEASVLEWKHCDPQVAANKDDDAPGYSISLREQSKDGWRQLGREMRLVNRTHINWTGKIPSCASNAGLLTGDLLRFSE